MVPKENGCRHFPAVGLGLRACAWETEAILKHINPLLFVSKFLLLSVILAHSKKCQVFQQVNFEKQHPTAILSQQQLLLFLLADYFEN